MKNPCSVKSEVCGQLSRPGAWDEQISRQFVAVFYLFIYFLFVVSSTAR